MTTTIIGRIYKLTSSETYDVYIGSSVQTLDKRLTYHKHDYRRYLKGVQHYITSYEIVKYVDATIELIHEGEFANIKEMHKMEGEYIQKTENCVNRIIPGRTKKNIMKTTKRPLKSIVMNIKMN